MEASDLSLGSSIIFAQELLIQKHIKKLVNIDICVIDKTVGSQKKVLLGNELKKKYQFANVISQFEGFGNCFRAQSLHEIKSVIEKNDYYAWPQMDIIEGARFSYETTIRVQDYYKKLGFFPALKLKKNYIIWVKKFFRTVSERSLPVVVHLKNKTGAEGLSNANMNVWYDFFRNCEQIENIKFILIGNEVISNKISKLKNVVISKKYGSNIFRDLALIEASFCFLGMSSGPCNMAIFSDVPYVIFKNPAHHKKEMKQELKGENKFIFSREDQKFFLAYETVNILSNELRKLINKRNIGLYERRTKVLY